MKKVITIMLLGPLLHLTVYADQIYGSLRGEDGQAIQASIEVACGDQVYRVGTDNYGTYSLHVQKPGRCTFKVFYNGQAPTCDIYSYDAPAKYDFDLIRQPNGQYILRRR